MLEQVLMNLCVNARDAMPDGGDLVLQTGNVEVGPANAELMDRNLMGRYVQIRVADTGTGIDEELAKRIFEPFFTTKGVGKGTGLGLAMVYGIVRQHNGEIIMKSEVGKGTEFSIYLPAIDRPVCKVIEGEVGEAESGTERVLLVEDDESLLKLAEIILRKAGYQVRTARNGEEAVREFTAHSDEIDLIVCDMVMPVMNGQEAIQKIQKLRPDCPYLFVSGYSEDEIRLQGVGEGQARVLRKPYRATALLKEIREVLEVAVEHTS
jgi:CheY-like chemotaxis protein